jgi:ATP-dependent RNA helicase DeaD
MTTSFNQFNLSKGMLRALEKMGFETPSPVQLKAIAPMMTGQDLIVQAPTGTGKTAAFGIPIIEAVDVQDRNIQAVIVCPTRELAVQITVVLHQLAVYKQGVRTLSVYGGESIERQIAALRKRPQIIVATPGRLIDHINRRTCRLDHVRIAVLDEADRMLDMGFCRDIEVIMRSMAKRQQTVLFSATIPKEVLGVAKQYQKDAETIKIGFDCPIETVKQFYINTEDKTPSLFRLLREQKFKLSLVFVATKRRADRVARQLCKAGFNAGAIHGDLNQNQRQRVMNRYRAGQISILVATDVAARGIDVHNIDAVINYDIPNEIDNYTHRIGRSGRAGAYGVAYTFVRGEDQEMMRDIMYVTNAQIQLVGAEDPTSLLANPNLGRKASAPAKKTDAGPYYKEQVEPSKLYSRVY